MSMSSPTHYTLLLGVGSTEALVKGGQQPQAAAQQAPQQAAGSPACHFWTLSPQP